MKLRQIVKKLIVTAGTIILGMLITYLPVRAANDNNGAQDEKQMSQIGSRKRRTLG